MRDFQSNRREFLIELGRGALVAGIGVATATDLGLLPLGAAEQEGSEHLEFGDRESLVDRIQQSAPDDVFSVVQDSLNNGTSLKEIVAAAALANARKFGGEDYIGFHTFMALAPAYAMSQELPTNLQALPVMKVLYRNASRIQATGGPGREALRPVAPGKEIDSSIRPADAIRDAVHRQNVADAERALLSLASPDQAWNELLETVHEATEVHRVVLAQRSWDMLNLVGESHARTMLRQSLRYCAKLEPHRERHFGTLPQLLVRLFDAHKLEGRPRGTKPADSEWIVSLSESFFRSTPEQAAEAVATALAEGYSADPICHAISLTANQLLLRDAGRTSRDAQAGKPVGSVHGDSIGLHACDSANAWRHLVSASNARNAAASLILAGYQVALDRIQRGGDFAVWQPRPTEERLSKLMASGPTDLLKRLDSSIRENDQETACAAAQRYLDLGHPARAAFDLLLSYAISEDGALHAEKFYRTASDEYARLPDGLKSRQIVALARVSASAFGQPAPGVVEARGRLSR